MKQEIRIVTATLSQKRSRKILFNSPGNKVGMYRLYVYLCVRTFIDVVPGETTLSGDGATRYVFEGFAIERRGSEIAFCNHVNRSLHIQMNHLCGVR